MSKRIALEGFDIIIDDASHIGELTKIAFWHLFDNHLKPGGLYVIEDWGTGYWDDWPDGKRFDAKPKILSTVWPKVLSRLNIARKIPFKIPTSSHNYGMVGFIKDLVDEQGAADLTRARLTGKPTRQSKFERLPFLFFLGLSFVSVSAPSWGLRHLVVCRARHTFLRVRSL